MRYYTVLYYTITMRYYTVVWKFFVLVVQTGLLPLGMADKVCLESPSWGILLTWPNHLSCDL